MEQTRDTKSLNVRSSNNKNITFQVPGVTYHMSYVILFVIQIVVTFEPKKAILLSSTIVISEKNADKLYLMKKY